MQALANLFKCIRGTMRNNIGQQHFICLSEGKEILIKRPKAGSQYQLRGLAHVKQRTFHLAFRLALGFSTRDPLAIKRRLIK